MPDIARLVEIKGENEGSGFLIGPGLVLTAWHVLRPPAGAPFPKHVQVRILGDYRRATQADRLKTRCAEVLWPCEAMDADHDFALLRVIGSPDDPENAFLPWAELPDWDEIEVRILGFPSHGKFSRHVIDPANPMQERDTVAVRGQVQAGSGLKQRLVYNRGSFDVVLRQEDLPEGSQLVWGGMSGAAVFAGPVLIGMVRVAAEGQPGLHRLRAIPVARLFAMREVQVVLRDAGLDLPPCTELASGHRGSHGFPSERLQYFGVAPHAPSEFRAGVERFLTSYLGSADRRVAFGGRDRMLERLDHWLDDPAAPPRLLLHAPGGRGKSALVVQWLLAAAGRCRPVFMPISARSETNLPRLFYQALAERLSELQGFQLRPPLTDDPVGHYRGACIDLLRRLTAGAKPVLLVIDGLDEAAGWRLPPALLPELPHPGLRVLVSARERTGDRGAEGWIRQLGWDRADPPPAVMQVEPLDTGGVKQLLCSIDPRFAESATAEVSAQIARLSGGDAWIVSLYAEDLCGPRGGTGRLQLEDLAARQPGFGPFFRDWLNDQKQIWRLRDQALDDDVLNSVLAILACALGPLRHSDLSEVYRCWRGAGLTLAREALEPIERFVQGDGVASGYVLAQPKFADFLRGEYFADPLMSEKARAAFLCWGQATISALDAETLAPASCPAYLVAYFGQHLVEAKAPVEVFMRLVDRGWFDAWFRFEGGFRGFSQDVRRVADAIEERALLDERRWAWRLRCQLVMSSVASASAKIPGWLIAECVRLGRLTGRQGLDLLEQGGFEETSGFSLDAFESQKDTAGTLVALARAWPRGAGYLEGIGDVLRTTVSIKNDWVRAQALKGLIPILPASLIGDALSASLSIPSDEMRAEALVMMVPGTSDALRAEALKTLLLTTAFGDQAKSIGVLAPSLPPELRSEVFAQARAEAGTMERPSVLTRVVDSSTSYLPAAQSETWSQIKATGDEKSRARLLVAAASNLPESMLAEAFEAALAIGDQRSRQSAVTALLPRLSEALLADATTQVMSWKAPYQRAAALSIIAPRVTDLHLRAEVFTQALEALDGAHGDWGVVGLLAKLASVAADDVDRTAVGVRAIRAIESMAEEFERANALALIVPQLPVALLGDALRLVKAMNDDLPRARAFEQLVPHLPEELLAQAFEMAIVMPQKVQRGAALAALAPRLPQALFGRALEALGEMAEYGGDEALARLVPRLPDDRLGQALVLAFEAGAGSGHQDALQLIVRRMSEPVLEAIFRELAEKINGSAVKSMWLVQFAQQLPDATLPVVLSVLEEIQSEFTRSEVLLAISPRLPGPAVDRVLRVAMAFGFVDLRVKTLAAIAPQLSRGIEREQAFTQALQGVGDMRSEHDRAEVLATLMPHLAPSLFGEALEKVDGISDSKIRAQVLGKFSKYLPEHLIARAWQIGLGITSPTPRAHALAALARCLTGDAQRADALEQTLKVFMSVGDQETRCRTFAALAARLPEGGVRTEAFDEALKLAGSLEDHEARRLAFAQLAVHRTDALRMLLDTTPSGRWTETAEVLVACLPASAYPRLLSAVSEISDEKARVAAVLALAKRLPEASRGGFLRLGLALKSEWRLANFLTEGAPQFDPALFQEARRLAKRMKSKFERDSAMKGLELHRPRPWISKRLMKRSDTQRAEQLVEASLREAETFKDLYRARALIDLAPSLPDRLAPEALRICASIGHDIWRASALKALVPHLQEARQADALRVAAGIGLTSARGSAIADIAPYLPMPLLGEALGLAEAMHDWHAFAKTLAGLAPFLDDVLLRRAIASALEELRSGDCRVLALSALGAHLPAGAQRDTLLSDALHTAEAIEGAKDRVIALRMLLPNLPETLKERAVTALLQAAGRVPRGHLLDSIPVLVQAVEGFQSEPSVLGVYQAVRDVGRWLP